MGIKVKVYAPGFINHDPLDENGFLDLREGASMHTLFQKLKVPVPLRVILAYSVNYEQAKLTTKLKDGDIVTFLFPFTGG